ncbi:F-box protein [Phanerochaete sordida]|uniref:F-box protein n=1 Tax=Phanerochaete sordida TaxID=48140 RepID=A0A9P3GCE5_9APHY|nr:F-box protein [Phanerochaete sordida]
MKRRMRGTKTAGKLAPLLAMPADIWFEVVSHLTPKDLLHLSRTSKHFRTMLVSQAQKHLWAAARRNVGFPKPPEHIGEPRVAAMYFSATCFSCGKRGLLCDLGLITRYCKGCKTERVKKGCTLRKGYDVSEEFMPVFQLLPSSRSDYHDTGRSNDETNDSYDAVEFSSVLVQYCDLLNGDDQVALQAFVDERKRLVQATRELSKALEEWEREQCNLEKDIPRVRQESIEEKLLELGYPRTDFHYLEISSPWRDSWREILRKSQKLTPRIWTRILPRLERLLAGAKTERERSERSYRRFLRERELWDVYGEFLRDVPADDGPLPHVRWVDSLPAVRALLDEDDARVPVTVARLRAVLPALQEEARSIRARLAQVVWAHFAERARPAQEPRARPSSQIDKTDGGRSASRVVHGMLLPTQELEPEELQNLPGVPQDVEPGSEAVLALATALFLCYRCVTCRGVPIPGAGDTVYSITELAAHIHTDHAAGDWAVAEPRVESEMARKVLNQLGLPEDVRYEVVSGRIVCGCATFRHPATLAQLISHIMQETSLHRALADRHNLSSCPSDEVLVDQHDFTSATPFLRLLDADETFAPEPLSDAESSLANRWAQTFDGKPIACRVCTLCATVPNDSLSRRHVANARDAPCVPHAPAMEPAVLVRHVTVTHGREARLDDAQHVQPTARS